MTPYFLFLSSLLLLAAAHLTPDEYYAEEQLKDEKADRLLRQTIEAKHQKAHHEMTDKEKEAVRMEMSKLLGIHVDLTERSALSKSKSSVAAARFLEQLFQKQARYAPPEEEKTVRSIMPTVVKSEIPRQASRLVFKLSAIPENEEVVDAEVHFNQHLSHKVPLNIPLSEVFKGRIQCVSCPQQQMFPMNRIPSASFHWALFIATDAVRDAQRMNASTVAVEFDRRGRRIAADRAVRYHAPFLVVYTRPRAGPSVVSPIPSSTATSEHMAGNRRKRSIDEYYHYAPVDDIVFHSHPDETEPDQYFTKQQRLMTERYEKSRAYGPRLLHERSQKKGKHRRPKVDDPMMGFGQTDVNADDGDQRPDPYLKVNPKVSGKQCGVRPLVINFADIGWDDWIIAPKSIEMNYCSGSCDFPLSDSTNPSNHAHIQSIVHALGVDMDVPAVCCAPQKFDSQTLLFYDEEGSVVLKNYPRMSVSSCQCA